MAEAQKPKIKPIPSLDDITGGNDIAKAMKPTGMAPISMADSQAGREEVTTGIPTAVLGMANAPIITPATAAHLKIIPNEDAKIGKAYLIATKTYKKFKVGTIAEFFSVVDEIKNNL